MTEPASTETLVMINLATTDFVLTHADRCDQCGARAYVQVWLNETEQEQVENARPKELLFCSHHFNHHKTALWGRYMFLNDERAQLTNGVVKDTPVTPGQEQNLPPRQKPGWEK